MYFFMYLGIFINIFFIALYICASYQMVFLGLFRNMLYIKHRKSVQWNLSIPNIFLNTCCFIQNWQVFWLDRLNGQWMSDFWSSELAGVDIRQIRRTKISDTVYSSLPLLRPSFLQWKYGLVRGVGSLVVHRKSGFIAHWLEWPYKRIPIELESNLKFYLHKLWIIYAGFSFNRFPCILLLSLFFVHN